MSAPPVAHHADIPESEIAEGGHRLPPPGANRLRERQRDLAHVPAARRRGVVRELGAAAGAVKAGLNYVTLAPGARCAPAHCHSLEEELFVVLSGTGTLTLGVDTHPLIAGDVVARPAGTGVTHALHAGANGLVYLVYGTREPGDAVLYPAAGKVWIRGLEVWLDSAAPPPGSA